MKKNYFFLILFFLAGIPKSFSQKIATLEVILSKATGGMAVPASIELDKLTYSSDSSLALIEIDGTKRTPVPYQISQGEQRLLNWLVKPGTGNAAKKKIYELQKTAPSKFEQITSFVKDG